MSSAQTGLFFQPTPPCVVRCSDFKMPLKLAAAQYGHLEISDNIFSSRSRSATCSDCSSSN
jgi:hypothetical protein